MAGFRKPALNAAPEAARIFLRDGEVPEEGTLIRQPDLAATLRALAEQGHDGFYKGAVAEKLVKGVRAGGGIWSMQDLAEYEIVEREPIRGEYRGMTVTAATPPSSGGVVLVEALNILEGFDLAAMDEATRTHVIVEAMRRAYRDRAEYLGDPDYVDMPISRLTHPQYAAGLRAGIRLDRATPSALLPGVVDSTPKGEDTTHFSIIDKDGNRVAATLSINYPFGAAWVVPGTGVLLNDEMDDFSAKPGVPNVYGLVGAEANSIQPGKRMLSSMTPTFLDDGKRIAVVGTPGGSRIISMVLLAALEFSEGRDAKAMVERRRFHHQFLPDAIQFEPLAFDDELQLELQSRGHELQPLDSSYGNMHVVIWDQKARRVEAASDGRGIGKAEVR
jgi:gamma-glutamyltranspeptidase/glutathione hydrolase